jgi:drug/metabolite transporter (DMT)-like permease
MARLLHSRPVVAVFAGVVCLAFSGILFRLSHVSPSTGAFFRCLLALPLLWLVMHHEDVRFERRPLRQRSIAWLAGIFFAFDVVLWHRAIEEVGAGLGTVLSNLQIVLVPFIAWLILREKPPPRALVAIPVVLVGIVLISGAFERGAYGRSPGLGVLYGLLTAVAYSGFLLVLRAGNRDLRRPAGPLFDATLSSAVVCLILGFAFGDLDLAPSMSAFGWLVLLAFTCQALGWLLVSITLPRLPATSTSVLLMVQPVLAMLFAALILSEAPTALQCGGVIAILVGISIASVSRWRRVRTAPEPAVAAV